LKVIFNTLLFSKNMNKKSIALFATGFIAAVMITVPITSLVFAEQSGGSPESGAVSRIKAIYDSLVSLGYGSDSAGGWGDWGNMWNRIRSAGEWTPDATATSDDVVAGETFYGSSRTEVTGSAQLAQEFSLQQYVEFDDYEGTVEGDIDPGFPLDDYEGEESEWTNTLPLAGGVEVWKDERTGLYWSHYLGDYSNVFPDQNHSDCDFFDESLHATRGDYSCSGPDCDTDCGNAINACAQLSLDADGDGIDETNWYLPTQKELQQAYLDGIFNQAGSSFTTTNYFWSSSEVSVSSVYAWIVNLADGNASNDHKAMDFAVRCVVRD
jgi:hypothetical protein